MQICEVLKVLGLGVMVMMYIKIIILSTSFACRIANSLLRQPI